MISVTLHQDDGFWSFEVIETDGDGYAFGTRDMLREALEAIEAHIERIMALTEHA